MEKEVQYYYLITLLELFNGVLTSKKIVVILALTLSGFSTVSANRCNVSQNEFANKLI